MGCGTSRTGTVVETDAPENLKEATQPPLISEVTDELTSVHSNTPDRDSKPVEPSTKSLTSPPILHPNGTEPPAPSLPEASTTPSSERETKAVTLPSSPPPAEESPSLPHSAGGRAVAFEVEGVENSGESLIKRHPPRKFQKLEEQQNNFLTQEKLEEKQAIAEKRRQEILTQRVQSAKQRSARSAGRMRTRPSETDDVEQLEDGIIESAANIPTENEL